MVKLRSLSYLLDNDYGADLRPLQFLCFQKSNVLVNCGSADVADPCELRHIQLLAFVGGVVAKEGGEDILYASTVV